MRVLVPLLGVLSFASQALFAQENWVVNAGQASCLFENIADYQGSEDEPIVIFLDVCPTVDRLKALQKMQKNSSNLPAPRVYVLNDGSEKEADKVIVYTKAELECLEQLEIPTSVGPVLLPQNPCRS